MSSRFDLDRCGVGVDSAVIHDGSGVDSEMGFDVGIRCGFSGMIDSCECIVCCCSMLFMVLSSLCFIVSTLYTILCVMGNLRVTVSGG